MPRARSDILTEPIRMPKEPTPEWAEKYARRIFFHNAIFDPAKNHRKADELMEAILIHHGYGDMVAYIRRQERWYE